MPSAKVSKRRARERLARIRAKQRRRARHRNILISAAVALPVAVLIAAAGLALAFHGDAPGVSGVRTFSGLSRAHTVSPVRYTQQPPAGGPHNPVWLNCGIYPRPVPDGSAVHSLEHGAVWITYRPDLPATAVSQLQHLVRGEPVRAREYAILSPYPGLPVPVVASAWGKQLRLAGPSDPRLQRFISTYAQGPQTPEPGAACSGGTGTPMP
ncbi:MAG: DUF3105 domain-containing protein [Micromonosporaceae bacterium]